MLFHLGAERLHDAGVTTYWAEAENAAEPEPDWDVVAGNVVVEVTPGRSEFTIKRSNGVTDSNLFWETVGLSTTPTDASTFAWSKRSGAYHHANCAYVEGRAYES